MTNPVGGSHGDDPVILGILKYLHRLLEAVERGHNIAAATDAHALVLCMKRFFPKELSSIGSDRMNHAHQAPLFSLATPRSTPNEAYIAVFRTAVEGFVRALNAGNIAGAVTSIISTGILAGELTPMEELQRLELELCKAPRMGRLEILPQVAKISWWLGKAEAAEASAAEVVNLGSNRPSVHGEAIHDANMVLGLGALSRGDLQGAVLHLKKSMISTSWDTVPLTGLNVSLANELLKKGENIAVSAYLEGLRGIWPDGRQTIDIWTRDLHAGTGVNFDLIHFCV